MSNFNPRNNIIWVQGLEGAKAFRTEPNSVTILFDDENNNIFYIKSTDESGRCKLKSFKYEEFDILNLYIPKSILHTEIDRTLRSLLEDITDGNKPSVISEGIQSVKNKVLDFLNDII